MTWQTFKKVFSENAERALKFAYSNNGFVSPGYHITEIKRSVVTSVDCGGVTNNWEEVIVQLWEPLQNEMVGYMKAEKALAIIKLVESKIELDPLSYVKIEYGNNRFDTRQMLPGRYDIENNTLVIYLMADTTQCKAQERDSAACCNVKGESKQKLVACC